TRAVQGLQQARTDRADPETGAPVVGPAIDRLGEHLVRRLDVETDGRLAEGPPVWILHVAARGHDGKHRAESGRQSLYVRRAPAEGGEPDRGQPNSVLAAVRRGREEAGEDATQRDSARACHRDVS